MGGVNEHSFFWTSSLYKHHCLHRASLYTSQWRSTERGDSAYLVLLGSLARLHFQGSLASLGVLVHQGFRVTLVCQVLQEALGWSGLMRTGWESG